MVDDLTDMADSTAETRAATAGFRETTGRSASAGGRRALLTWQREELLGRHIERDNTSSGRDALSGAVAGGAS